MNQTAAMGPVLIVLHKLGASLGFYDVHAGTALVQQETGPFPHELCKAPDGQSFFVAEYGLRGTDAPGPGGSTVGIFDIRSAERTGTLSTGRYDRPHGIGAGRNGDGSDRLVVTSETTDRLLIFHIQSGELLHAVAVSQQAPHCVGLDPSGAFAYTSNIGSGTVTKIDVERGEVQSSVRVGERPEGMAFSPDGALLFLVNRESNLISIVDTAALSVVGAISTGQGPVRIAITPDGKRLAFPLFHQDAVQIADARRGCVTHTIPVGRQPAGTALSADGALLFVSCELEDTVYVISMDEFAIVRRIRTGCGPDAMMCI
jgi:YVTN family beta-propeller protein